MKSTKPSAAKYLFLIECPTHLGIESFRETVLRRLLPSLLKARPLGLKVNLSSPALRHPRFVPFNRAPFALLSLWQRRPPSSRAIFAALAKAGLPFHAYRVDESIPRPFSGKTAAGKATRGVSMVTLFRRKRGLSRETFLARWHVGHLPIALEYHPTVQYVRNVVEEALTPGAPPWGGIVEEQFPDNETLCSMRRFVGGGRLARVVPRLLHILLQTRTFLDLFTLENRLLEEIWVKRP